ncbi:MAG: ParB/RepB/Spo0J family partition protein [Armatimonadota bacterium]|nr:ParB/RepB/Spo0J family partition protein [Armatimonadota bacterium]MCX7777108.1 ParB/RepB/Spo0J family partition protein [Armatimonadota bacterium]MDW8025155.1 ParB/RepB/Spo0J family partition protein [Armatimonadota bacterium]
MRKRGLGRGLDALIPSAMDESWLTAVTPETTNIVEIDVDHIKPNPFQPRRDMDQRALQELADSIRAHGLLQPIVVRQIEDGYQLVTGERRWRAAVLAGLRKLPAIIRQCDDQEMIEFALIENLQREDINPIEEAEAYFQLSRRFGMTQEEIAARVGKSRAAVANAMRLLQLPEMVKEAIRKGEISEGHGRALLMLDDERLILQALSLIKRHSLSVRQTEALARRLKEQREKVPKEKREMDPNLLSLQDALQERLQMRVRIKPGRRGGTIEIRYLSDSDLQRLVDLVLGEVFSL